MDHRVDVQVRRWLPPDEFDGYRLVRHLGAGAMGDVYLGHDTVLDRPVALKFIGDVDADARARERFFIEARAIARLQHPNVVGIYRVGQIGGRPYLASEFVRGKSLDRLALPLPWQEAARVGLGLARGLAAAHRRGVLHRDLKPANAILADDGEVKLLDFGLAKIVEARPLAPGAPARASDAPSVRPAPPEANGAPSVRPAPPEANGAPSVRPAPPTASGAPDATLSVVTNGAPRVSDAARTVDTPSAVDGESCAPEANGVSAALTQDGAMLGTPLYMAPELFAGEQASSRSDVYAMGALLYQLAAGQPPHMAPSVNMLWRKVCLSDARPLAEAAPGVDPAFAAVIDRCLRRDPAERFASGEELREALERAAGLRSAPKAPQGNPYRGLRAFDVEHRGVFFGRDAEVSELVERLRTEPFVLVAGDSGVGKSSVCRAGVLPRVSEGQLGGARSYAVAMVVPGKRPLAALTHALAQHLGADEASIEAQMSSGLHAFGRDLVRRQSQRAGLLLFVDQLEELVTQSDPDEARRFAESVLALAHASPGIRVLATVRGDFLTRVAAIPTLSSEVTRALYLLGPMTREGIREAVVGPAEATGVRFESEAMVDALVDETAGSQGSLPLLQFALAELWDARDASQSVIPASALEAVGGVSGALARHADGVLAGLLPPERSAARRILLLLVTPEGTRARRTEEELGASDPTARTALDALVRGRLLVAREEDGAGAYEVAHEALITQWSTLQGWLTRGADTRLVRERLMLAASEWERLGRAKEGLYSERQVAEAARIDPEDLGAREGAFLAASRRAISTRRRTRWGLGLGIPLVVLLSFAGVRAKRAYELDRRIDAQLAEASAAFDEARRTNAEIERLRTEALGLFDASKKDEAEKAWDDFKRRAKENEQAFAAVAQKLEAALAEDASRGDVRSLLGDVDFERALHAERDRNFTRRDELLERLDLHDPDSSRRARWNAPATLVLTTDPPGASVALERYVDEGGRRRPEPAGDLGKTPLQTSLAPGSYRLRITAEGKAPVVYPVLLTRGERFEQPIRMLDEAEVPKDFIYVPAGRFLYGSGEEEIRWWFNADPIHEARTGDYLIARNETTFGEWLEFVDALPPEERDKRTPGTGSIEAIGGGLRMVRSADGLWRIAIQPTSVLLEASQGLPLKYPDRNRRAVQDWSRWPVSVVSLDDAKAYARWLHLTARVPNARLCSDLEWERAARGADDRRLPHGNRLEPDDANFDLTYGKATSSFGPDEIGSHPRSASPFGAEDMAGNVWEWVSSGPGEQAIRGGGYYHNNASLWSVNRETPEPLVRDLMLGMRTCADVPRR